MALPRQVVGDGRVPLPENTSLPCRHRRISHGRTIGVGEHRRLLGFLCSTGTWTEGRGEGEGV